MGFVLLGIVATAWVILPAILIGWIAGFWDLQIIAAAVWGLAIIIIYIRTQMKSGMKFDLLIYFLAFIQACIGGLIVYYIALATH